MNIKRKNWKVWCVTEGKWVKVWKKHTDSAPTECPTDGGHTITSSLTGIEEEQEALIVEKTSNPTVDDDFDAGYDVNAKWLNTSSNKIFECTDSTVGTAVWIELTKKKTVEEITCPAEDVNSTSYALIDCGTFTFRGTTELGIPAKIKAIVQKEVVADSVDVRIYDIDNSQEICAASYSTDENKSRLDLGTLSNLPAEEATFEIQVKRTGINGKVRCFGISIQW